MRTIDGVAVAAQLERLRNRLPEHCVRCPGPIWFWGPQIDGTSYEALCKACVEYLANCDACGGHSFEKHAVDGIRCADCGAMVAA